MKASGKREKGAKLERRIAKEFRRSGLDKKAKRSWQSGATWYWKSDIYTSLSYAIECKNQERIQLWKWWEQTESQRKAYKPPVLMLTSNYRPILCVMELQDWINMNLELQEYKKLHEKLL